MKKRHHFVPEVLQRRFACPDGKLWACGRRQQPFSTTPGNLFAEGHLYTYVDDLGGKSAELEELFWQVEDRVGPVFDKVVADVRRNAFPVLQPEEWTTLMTFFIHQYKRVPSFFKPIVKAYEPYLDNLIPDYEREVRPLSDVERAAAQTPENLRRILKNSMLERLGSISEFMWNATVGRGVGFARVMTPQAQFVVGSNPIARFRGTTKNDLSDPTVEMWLPIAPDVAIGSVGHSAQGTFIRITAPSPVKKVNQQIAATSEIVASSSRELVRALMRRQPEKPPERVPVLHPAALNS